MYHVIDTVLTAILLYLISYIFYRIGYFSIQFHKKIWNSILAAVFIVAVAAGVFMALQINYKWNVPFVKTVLKWHVEFGIGLAVTGIFHFIWNLSYYGKIFSKSDNYPKIRNRKKETSSRISTNLFIVGLVSSSVQILLIREMMNIAGGYEIITGTFFASWLIASAIGASLANKSSLNDLKTINLFFSISPLISLLLLLFLARVFLNAGETPSFLISVIYTFIVLVPFCLVSGFTFVKLINFANSDNDFLPGKSFSIETTGSITSGILLSIFTSGLLNTYQLLLLIVLLSAAYVLFSFFIISPKVTIISKIFILILASVIIIFNPDIFFRRILLPGINVTGSKDTSYGNITLGMYKGEQSLYYNHRLQVYNDDVTEREEDIHYAMLQSKSPQKVILISGSLRSHLPEILKYPVKSIIYIERDPALAKFGISSMDILPKELTFENEDAYRYIRNSSEMADVIILLVPPPSTLLLNRYYTTEFFNMVKKRLNSGGIFMCSPGSGEYYMNQESLNLYSSIYNSLEGVFKNVKPVVGNKLYFVSSDAELSVSYCKLAGNKNIMNTYVSSDYLDDGIITKKSDEVKALMNSESKQNRSAFPVGSLHFQSYNLSKNPDEKIPVIVLMLFFFAMPIMKIRRKNMIMFLSASALAGFEIIMLLTLQIIEGNMYQLTGLVIAGLMMGLAVGAGVNINFLNSFKIRIKTIILFGFYIGFGFIYNNILTMKSGLPAVSLVIISVILPALYTGHIFRELTLRREQPSSTAKIYSADLAGSALGFIFISVFAIPAFGIKASIFLLSALIFAGFLFGTDSNK